MKKHMLLIWFVTAVTGSLSAQNQQKKPQESAYRISTFTAWQQYQEGKVQLLWMPSLPANWLEFNNYGYKVERAEWPIKENVKKIKFVPLTKQSIRPLPKGAWKNNTITSYLAQTAIYGDTLRAKIGKEDITGKNTANQQSYRHLVATNALFKSFMTAQNMGLAYVDSSVLTGKRYVYRIYVSFPASYKGQKDTLLLLVDTKRNTKIKNPPILQVNSLEHAVQLSWNARDLLRDFMLYHIQRSDDGITFRTISKNPIYYGDTHIETVHHVDSVAENYRPYAYRLLGMTPFGKWATSTYIAMGMGKDRTPPEAADIESAVHLGGKRVQLKWLHKDSDGDMAGFYISRSNEVSGSYKRLNVALNSKKSREFTDFQADPNSTNYYMVVAVDTAGNERTSLPFYVVMKDSIPPAPPKGLVAKVDTLLKKGIVTIRWRQNQEKDLKGYRVYVANNPNGEFLEITRTLIPKDTVFRDTISLLSLTKNVLYRVVAVDNHFNHSRFSEVLEAKRPDIIRPVAPLITSLTTDDKTITVKWQRSPSNDVKAYNLYRREQDKEWVRVKAFQGTELEIRQYKDPAIKEGRAYEYALEVMDASGLVSERSPRVSQTVIGSAYLTDAPEVKATYDEEKKTISLTWRYANYTNYQLVIYRSLGKKPPVPLGTADPGQKEFKELALKKGQYGYLVKAVFPNGKQSLFSPKTTIKVN